MKTLKGIFATLALLIALAGMLSSCASVSDCPAYGASKKGTYQGYNSPYYRR